MTYKQDIEKYRGRVAHVEEAIQRDERGLEDLDGKDRERLGWRLHFRRIELRLMYKYLQELEEEIEEDPSYRDLLQDLRDD